MAATPEQQRAIAFPQGEPTQNRSNHLVIEAGAGAGKTYVLCQRVWALCQRGVAPSRLVLATFTQAAAGELRHRVAQQLAQNGVGPALQYAADLMSISTIDSLMGRVLQSVYGPWWESQQPQDQEGGLPPVVTVADDGAIWEELDAQLQHHLEAGHLLDKSHWGEFLDFVVAGGFERSPLSQNFGVGSTRDQLVRLLTTESFLSPQGPVPTVATRRTHPMSLKLLEALHRFARQQHTRRLLSGRLTHTDITVFLHHVLCHGGGQVPLTLEELIVDEYQDTSRLQHQVLLALAQNSGGRMTVVGDPKQSIYRFRNAQVDVFTSLIGAPGWTHIVLRHNFRSQPQLLDTINSLANQVFQCAPPQGSPAFAQSSFARSALRTQVAMAGLLAGRSPEATTTQRDGPARPPTTSFLSASLDGKSRLFATWQRPPGLTLAQFQMWALARTLTQCHRRGVPWDHMALLCETNSQVVEAMAVLQGVGVPAVTFQGGEPLPHPHTPVRMAILSLTWLCSPLPVGALLELAMGPLGGFTPPEALGLLAHVAQGCGGDATLWVEAPPKAFLSWDPHPNPAWKGRFQHWLNLWQEHRAMTPVDPYGAWHQLLWALGAGRFWGALAPVARSLYEKLQLSQLRSEVLARVASLTQGNPILGPLPLASDPSLWPQPHLPPQGQGHQGVTVLTVHKSKGLEWPLVAFWPKKSQTKNKTFTAIGREEGGVAVKWLAEDPHRFSLTSPVESPFCAGGDGDEAPNGTQWWADTQVAWEEHFERQRVFYTALTRAREHLILVDHAPRGNTLKGLRDHLATGKKNGAPWPTALEDTLMASFLWGQFHLRKPGGRGAVPPEPWAQKPTQANPLDPANGGVVYDDYGPLWAPEAAHELAQGALEKGNALAKTPSSPFLEASFTTPTAAGGFWKPLPPRTGGPPPAPGPTTPPLPSSGATHSRLRAQHRGLVLHTAVQYGHNQGGLWPLLGAWAHQSHFEYEIWGERQTPPGFPKAQLLAPPRSILDALFVGPPGPLAQALEEEGLGAWAQKLLPQKVRAKSQVALVVDLKTGAPQGEHRDQVVGYMDALAPLLGEQVEEFGVLGLLVYSGDGPWARLPKELGSLGVVHRGLLAVAVEKISIIEC